MDFPKKQQQCLIPRYLLQYLTSLQTNHNDPTAPWGGGGGGTYTAGDGIEISDEDVISIDNTVALKTDIPSLTGYATETWVTNQGYLVQSDLSDYITSSELITELGNYVTTTDLATELLNYAELDDIPTNTSDLTNDSGFITSSALTNYVTTNTTQEITGAKTFKGSYKITCQSTANEGASVAFKASSQSSSEYPIGVMEIDERLKVMKFSVNGVVGPDYVPALGYFGGSWNYDYVAKLPKGRDKFNSILSGDVYLPLSVNKTKADSSGNISLNIPTNTSDLNNDSGYITSSALTGYATESWVTNQGYLTSVSWNDILSKPTFATVATSGSYNDLTNKPTIPDAVSGTNDGTYWTSLTIGSDTYGLGGSTPANVVTTDTDQDIDGVKTFLDRSVYTADVNITGTSSTNISFSENGTYPHTYGSLQATHNNIRFNGDSSSTNSYYLTLQGGTLGNNAYVGFTVQGSTFSQKHFFAPNPASWNSSVYPDHAYYIPMVISDGTTNYYANEQGIVTIPSGGSSYTAGTGIDITNDVISIDNTVALKTDIPTVPTNVSAFTNDAGYVTSSSLATVATSGSYADLSNKPSIPSTATSTSTSIVTPSTIQLTFTFEDDTTQTVTLMTGATVSTTTTTTLS